MADAVKAEDLRGELRAALLANDSTPHRSELVEHEGKTFEVRQLTLAAAKYVQRTAVDKDGKPDDVKALVLALVKAVYVPGTNQTVLEPSDLAALGDKPATGLLKKLIDALSRVSKEPQLEEVEKNSAGTNGGSSSF